MSWKRLGIHSQGRGEPWAGQSQDGASRAEPSSRSPQVIYFQSALDKLNEAIKLAKVGSCPLGLGASPPSGALGCQAAGGAGLGWVSGPSRPQASPTPSGALGQRLPLSIPQGQPETVQEALRFTMDVIGGK